MKIKKSLATETSKELQNLFVFSVIGAFVVPLAIDILRAINQVATNPNLSSFYITFLSLGLLPGVLLATAYALHTNGRSLRQKAFDSLVFVVSVMATYIVINALLFELLNVLKYPSGDVLGSFGQQAIIAGIVGVASVLYLLTLKRSNRW